MNRMKSGNSGYALVCLVIIISVIFTIGGVILAIATMNYKMKIVNSKAEKAFYLAEAGAEEAYVLSKKYVKSAIEYSNIKVIDFKENVEQNSYEELNEIFHSSFKEYINGNNLNAVSCIGLANTLNDNSLYLIHEEGYPIVNAVVKEKIDYFLIEIKSIYVYEEIEKNTILELKITIPLYDTENSMNSIIEIINWEVEG